MEPRPTLIVSYFMKAKTNGDGSDSGLMKSIPDLINFEATAPSNLEEMREDLQFAFSSGESAGTLRSRLSECDVSSSSWEEDCFADDLFLDELLDGCFRIPAARFGDSFVPPQNLEYLKKILVHPPADGRSASFRQDIQKELMGDPGLRDCFETAYRALSQLREELDSPGIMGREYSTRRRIDILLQIKRTVDALAAWPDGARSGITRIREWAREFQGSSGYLSLNDFVDYEGRMSTVRVELCVGVDGTLRSFRITDLAERTESRFYKSPVARLMNRLGLLLRGYKVSDDEIVARVVERVFDAIDAQLSYFLPLIGHMEFHLASLAFMEHCATEGLATCWPSFVDADEGRGARGLFNPLLFELGKQVVPCDLKTERDRTTVVITGPNSGGKTRLLQSLGFLQLLGQSGTAVPAQEASVRFKNGLFVSLMENGTALQQEGRLGTELLRIRRLFEKCPKGSLIILDELCSGTNPSEGEEIFLLVISLLKELDPEVFLTTHFLRFAKNLAADHSNLALEFIQVDLNENHEPTYQFVPGVAQTSLAGHIAKRLGVTQDHLLALIAQKEPV